MLFPLSVRYLFGQRTAKTHYQRILSEDSGKEVLSLGNNEAIFEWEQAKEIQI